MKQVISAGARWSPLMPIDNVRAAVLSRLPVGVECLGCRHRALVDLMKLGGHSGDMRELRALRFTCADCGGRNVRASIFATQQQVLAFMPDEHPQELRGRPSF
jgi:hypothetical protein